MNQSKKIAIFTGNRAEYGLQYPIIKAIDKHELLKYYLLVSGSHLQEDFGYTKKEIEKDGFDVYGEVKLEMETDTLYSTAQAIGTGILSLSEHLNTIQPDFLVVYADRYEGLAAVITGTQMNIPTAHIEGGDITEGGALDDSVRHAMTKLSHLHFTTNEEAANRIKRLGEEPWRVFNVGFPAIDLISEGNFATPEEIVKQYGLNLNKPIVLFTQHSITTEYKDAKNQIIPSIEALKQLSKMDIQVIITYPNNDAGGRAIINEILKIDTIAYPNIYIYKSLGRYNYHGILNLMGNNGIGVCVGNSSSGIKETPAFGCPFVNIGKRQLGRLRADNVVDVPYDSNEIIKACKKSIEDQAYRQICRSVNNPYGIGDAGKKIAKVLWETRITSKLLQKKITY